MQEHTLATQQASRFAADVSQPQRAHTIAFPSFTQPAMVKLFELLHSKPNC